jgi:hypothetical protein
VVDELAVVCEDAWDEALDALRAAAPAAPLTEMATALGSRRRMRIALAGDWGPLLDGVERAASACAAGGAPRHATLTVLDAFAEALMRRAVQVYTGSPGRLAAALRDMRELSRRVAAAIEDAYLATPPPG